VTADRTNGSTATLRLLASDPALIADGEGVAEVIGARCTVVTPGQIIAGQPATQPRDPWLVEASVIRDPDTERAFADRLTDTCEVLLVGGAGEREHLADWLSSGRAVFLRRPLDLDYLAELLRDIFSELGVVRPGPKPPPPALDQFGHLFGSSEVMRDLYRQLRKAARTEATLLITGESGTGKELIARSVHSYSARRDREFESINCSAIPGELIESELFGHEKGSFTGADRTHRGVFERAGDGTLFLDEITEMPMAAQAKLLRILETNRFRRLGGKEEMRCRARVIAAGNRDPQQAIDDGELRLDLYYRLCQMEILAPPLRDRGDDIVRLARHFTHFYTRQTGRSVRLGEDAEHRLLGHLWPGNVRELRHCILSAARMARDVIRIQDIDNILESTPSMGSDASPRSVTELRAGMTIAEAEEALIALTLKETDGVKAKAARLLGISVRTLYNRMQRYHRDPSGDDS